MPTDNNDWTVYGMPTNTESDTFRLVFSSESEVCLALLALLKVHLLMVKSIGPALTWSSNDELMLTLPAQLLSAHRLSKPLSSTQSVSVTRTDGNEPPSPSPTRLRTAISVGELPSVWRTFFSATVATSARSMDLVLLRSSTLVTATEELPAEVRPTFMLESRQLDSCRLPLANETPVVQPVTLTPSTRVRPTPVNASPVVCETQRTNTLPLRWADTSMEDWSKVTLVLPSPAYCPGMRSTRSLALASEAARPMVSRGRRADRPLLLSSPLGLTYHTVPFWGGHGQCLSTFVAHTTPTTNTRTSATVFRLKKRFILLYKYLFERLIAVLFSKKKKKKKKLFLCKSKVERVGGVSTQEIDCAKIRLPNSSLMLYQVINHVASHWFLLTRVVQ
mmetsp:Transcript_24511/g.61455  ORF Transcript_24511/g.61455 Transcript_24511/m.61455 type:complete len:391 (+) Transcript_24511:469-1641(+)